MASTDDFANRLRKNARHLRKWARREGTTAYRLYDLDIPEVPFAIDWYDGAVHVVDYPSRRQRREGSAFAAREAVRAAIQGVLEVPDELIFFKTHLPLEWGEEQYQRFDHRGVERVVEEHGLKFLVNLSDYLDTGLFLDHRPLRARVRKEARGKRFLNVFAYTGAFTVHAAAGGARETTTLDLSKKYLDWAGRNLELNGISGLGHLRVRADARQWLAGSAHSTQRYDLIVLDPPSFSTSKAMQGALDIQRDHPRLIADAMALLSPGGVLYFSTNFQQFELAARACPRGEEITSETIPEDFRQAVHRCWRFVR